MVERTMCFMTTGEEFVVTIIILWTVELQSHDEFRFSQSLDNKREALVFRELIGWGGQGWVVGCPGEMGMGCGCLLRLGQARYQSQD